MSFDLKLKNGDLVIQNGQLQTVVDSEKLIQDILKICLTMAGANPMFPWYGSFLSRAVIGSSQPNSVLMEISRQQLNTALDNLKSLQEMQVKSNQNITADEQIGAILALSVVRNQMDPRLVDIKIKALTKGLKPITTAFSISTI
jgi:hypothetical protein